MALGWITNDVGGAEMTVEQSSRGWHVVTRHHDEKMEPETTSRAFATMPEAHAHGKFLRNVSLLNWKQSFDL